MPIPKLSFPRPTVWDFVAVAALILGIVVAAMSLRSAVPSVPGQALSTNSAIGYAVAQLLVCSLSLAILGKTAKSGTVFGNLAALGGIIIGISGGLLAAALWAVA